MGKVWQKVWIVGASSGIGAALAIRFASEGSEVIASARRLEALTELSNQHSNIRPLVCDVGDNAAVDTIIGAMEESDDVPDLVIFCAGVYEPGGVDVLTHDAAEAHMRVNYLGAVGLIEALHPLFLRRKSGTIAVVSSLTAYVGLPKASLYGPTKAALVSLCETLRPEFEKQGLGMVLINPGFVATRLTEKNTFDMPFLMTSEQAAARIYDGLQSGRFEIVFPRRLAWLLRGLSLLPYWLYFRLMGRMVA